MNKEILNQLQELLALATGHSPAEILPGANLEVDLGVNMEEDFPRLLAVINQEFEIELDMKTVLAELDEAEETVEQLAKLVEEEVELG